MKHFSPFLLSFLCLLLFSCQSSVNTGQQATSATEQTEWAIILHGGAGNFWNGNIPSEKKKAFEKSMLEALAIGETILENGGSSIDAVEQAIHFLEDDSLFNSGRGAVLTNEGTAELDASIMTGNDLNAGAVAGVKTVRHPISAARMVMENSPHVMLSGEGADYFAKEEDLEIVENDYFITSARKAAYDKRMKKEQEKMGTVGCVAIDKNGNITAGTSTGGMSNKKWGRVGDSPIIGAGTYANNQSCGVSATGWGEFFIRGTVARDIAALMEMKNYSSQEAADEIIQSKLPSIGEQNATGGVIVIDHTGTISYSFNTIGMLYAFSNSKGKRKFGLYD